MFGKVAADILGLSDVGSVIKPENYDKVDSDDYVMFSRTIQNVKSSCLPIAGG